METEAVGPYAEYIASWRALREREHAAHIERAHRSRAAAYLAATRLAQEFAVRRVWLFGSLLQIETAHARTDIDLAVEGLPPERYFRALARLYDLLPPGIELDLVTIETAQPTLRTHILAHGQILYERE